ncbi:MAG: futalosine hydrolase [Fibrobacter sp.]|nr:futalosine hydrolase [Fibrobacter sp.]
MSRLLITFASLFECQKVFPEIETKFFSSPFFSVAKDVDAALLDVGLLPFATALTSLFSKNYWPMVIQAGIAGAYLDRGLSIGDLVRVDTEILGDQGFQEANGSFQPWPIKENGKPVSYSASHICYSPREISELKGVRGLTVNTCTGTSLLAETRRHFYDVDVESMEGASIFALAPIFNFKAYEVRAISNYVSDRQKSEWRAGEALTQLRNKIIKPMVFS